MTTYVTTAFSLNMVRNNADLEVRQIPYLDHPKLLGEPDVQFSIGHHSTARILGLPYNRSTVHANPGDVIYVAQYQGPRLQEGAVNLPEGAKIQWYKVTIKEADRQ